LIFIFRKCYTDALVGLGNYAKRLGRKVIACEEEIEQRFSGQSSLLAHTAESRVPQCFALVRLDEEGPVFERGHRTRSKRVTCRHGRANFRRRRRCLCAPGSNPGRRPADRHAVQKALL
jgi:hypothetical protein